MRQLVSKSHKRGLLAPVPLHIPPPPQQAIDLSLAKAFLSEPERQEHAREAEEADMQMRECMRHGKAFGPEQAQLGL